MATHIFPEEVYTTQREFIRAMDANRDFVWWARTLIVEETNELEEVFRIPNKTPEQTHNLFKELGDLVYVIAGFYNTMPVYAPELVSEETSHDLETIMGRASLLISEVSHAMIIEMKYIIRAFEEVHRSNMSKLQDDGTPLRREDGKILKGPNYTPPDLSPIVEDWYKEISAVMSGEDQINARVSH